MGGRVTACERADVTELPFATHCYCSCFLSVNPNRGLRCMGAPVVRRLRDLRHGGDAVVETSRERHRSA